jgi:hypothetical protein
MHVTEREAASMYARACRAWYGQRAPRIIKDTSSFTLQMTNSAFAYGRWSPNNCLVYGMSPPCRAGHAFSNERAQGEPQRSAIRKNPREPFREPLHFSSTAEEQCGHAATVSNFLAAIAHLPPPAQRSAIIELLINHAAHQRCWPGRDDQY